jgi:hypothetical protein
MWKIIIFCLFAISSYGQKILVDRCKIEKLIKVIKYSDSVISVQDTLLSRKDSLINNLSQQLDIQQLIIKEKDTTITSAKEAIKSLQKDLADKEKQIKIKRIEQGVLAGLLLLAIIF